MQFEYLVLFTYNTNNMFWYKINEDGNTEDYGSGNVNSKLNELGKYGWEFISNNPELNGRYIFKRRSDEHISFEKTAKELELKLSNDFPERLRDFIKNVRVEKFGEDSE